ncbi:MAG: leucine-rich repeat domain-containing protein, partial [Eubacteriales bacterium]|nr:leucine-rich repeat domain-containing protein [Eubacteriales bacterium]
KIVDISPLKGMSELNELSLRDNSVSDISVLSGFTKLQKLWIQNNPIDDYSPLDQLPAAVEITK